MFVCLSAAFAVENMRNHIKIVFLFGQTKLFYTFAASFSRTVLADVLPVNLKKYYGLYEQYHDCPTQVIDRTCEIVEKE